MNINAHRQGQRVVVLPTARGNYLSASFPGWGKPDAHDHLFPMKSVVGMQGTVISVNSHGSNPWTRYSLRLTNGGHVIDAVEGVDFNWA